MNKEYFYYIDMIQEIDIYIIFGLVLVFLNTIFYFKKSGDIIENWFGRCVRQVRRKRRDRNNERNKLYATEKVINHLESKSSQLEQAKEIQNNYKNTLQTYKDDANQTLLESEKAIDQSQFTNSFITDEYLKNVYILGNVL